jgi:hypothetical protein
MTAELAAGDLTISEASALVTLIERTLARLGACPRNDRDGGFGTGGELDRHSEHAVTR